VEQIRQTWLRLRSDERYYENQMKIFITMSGFFMPEENQELIRL